MFKKKLAAAVGAAVVAMSFGASAQAAPCEGLACPNVLPAGAAPQALGLPVLPAAASRDLTKLGASGYYAYNTPGLDSQLSVAYVVTPGAWDATPEAVKGLAPRLLPAEMTTKTLIIYGDGALESGPWEGRSSATATSVTKGHGGRKKPTASAAAFSDCVPRISVSGRRPAPPAPSVSGRA